MKFTDGYWLMRPGCTARYATEVADVRADDNRLTLYAPVKHVSRRGDTLNSPLLTVECWSPAEGVIGVRTTHHAGSARRGPEFALPGAGADAGKVRRDGAVLELVSGELTLRVDTEQPWRLEFIADGHVLTSAGERGNGFVTDAEGRHHMLAQLSLGVGEACLRPGGAIHASGKERADGGHLAGRRRHQQRTGLQEHPVPPDQPRIRRLREPSRQGRLRGRLGSRRPGPVQRRGPVAGVLRRPRSDPEAGPGALHRAHRPPGPAAGLGAGPVADHVLHHRIRRGHGLPFASDVLRQRHPRQ